MLEADARALTALHLKDSAGQPTYALEMPADFDFWNILCAEAGRPALDLDAWHLADADAKESQMRGLELIHNIFQGLAITPPSGKGAGPPGLLFAQQRTSLLIAPSDLTASLPASFHYGMTVLPRDITPATVANVNGWAIPAKSTPGRRRARAGAVSDRPARACRLDVHQLLLPPTIHPPPYATRRSRRRSCRESIRTPRAWRNISTSRSICWRIIPEQTPEVLFAKIQAQLRAPSAPAAIRAGLPLGPSPLPPPKVEASSQIRGLNRIARLIFTGGDRKVLARIFFGNDSHQIGIFCPIIIHE